MRTLELAVNLYRHYGEVEEICHYYGELAQYALAQAAYEARDERLLADCRGLLSLYPNQIDHPHYNFECYRIGGNASAWADLEGILCRPAEIRFYAEQTMRGDKDANGVLCMPGCSADGPIWIDTAAAVTPFTLFAGLSLAREDMIDFAAAQCFGLVEALMDESCGLLHQCRGFIESDRRKCSEDHWSRGNGWGYMALAELVRYLPADSPHRSKAERIFTDLSLAFLRWQASGGLWRQELTSQAAWEESSGSALILYGLGVGLRTGLLDRGLFWKPYQNGLAGLLRCINPDYSTENSCPGCLCPGDGTIQAYITEKQPEHDEHHSFGAFMLALVEAHRNGFTDSEWRSL